MEYTSEHRNLIATVERFCAAEINPHVAAWEKQGRFPAHELFEEMGALGLLGINKPAAYGGLGLDYSFQLAFCEALGVSRLASVNLAVGVQVEMATPALARHGSPELCEEFLTKSISGEFVACLGVSEIGAGSDMASITTTARRDGTHYVINGGKMWTTNGAQADWMCVLANTATGAAQLNKSLICLPMNSVGVSVSAPLSKLGMRASDTVEVRFEEVRVPIEFRIGREGRGLLYQMQCFNEERLWAAASGLRSMERLIVETAQYARQRRLYGKALLDNQAIQFRLAELQTNVEMLRSLVYRAVDHHVSGNDVTLLASMSKLAAGRLQREVADACLQYWGGMGFLDEVEISRYYRDMRLTSIGGGADEVMLMMIARLLGLAKQETV